MLCRDWVTVLEAELVAYAGRSWDCFRERGGPAPRLDWLWDLVRACRYARTRGLRKLSPRDQELLRFCAVVVRDEGAEALERKLSVTPSRSSRP